MNQLYFVTFHRHSGNETTRMLLTFPTTARYEQVEDMLNADYEHLGKVRTLAPACLTNDNVNMEV